MLRWSDDSPWPKAPADAFNFPAGRLPEIAGVSRSLTNAGAPERALLKSVARVVDIADLRPTREDGAAMVDDGLVRAYAAGSYVDPPVTDPAGRVLDGHLRVASAAAAGHLDIFVVVVGEDLRKGPDDEVGDIGMDDDELLAALAGSLGGETEDLLQDALVGGGELQADALGVDFDDIHPDAIRRVKERRTKLEDVLDETTAQEVRNAIRAGMEDGDTEKDMIERLVGLGAFGEARARRIARTETHNSVMGGAYESMKQNGVKYLTWIAASDARPSHREASGQRVRTGAPFQVGDAELLYPGDPVGGDGYPEEVINCFVPGTTVQGRFNLGFRARYAGPVREIVTRSGNVLAVTPNHPVCTARGVVAAKDVREGDKVVAYAGNVHESGAALHLPDDQHAPAKIEDVFRALGRRGESSFVTRNCASNFHGDAEFFKSDVDVVVAQRELLRGTQSSSAEGCGDVVLVRSDLTQGAHACGGDARPHAAVLPLMAVCFGSGADLDFPLRQLLFDGLATDSTYLRKVAERNSGLVLSDDVFRVGGRVGSVAQVGPGAFGPHRYAASDKLLPERFSAYADAAGQCLHEFSGVVSAQEVVEVEGVGERWPKLVGLSSATNEHSEFAEFSSKRERRDSERKGERGEGRSGEVFLEDVLGVREYEFVGHVYDLQSENGLIIANGVCCGNCRCTVLADFEEPTTPDELADEIELEDVEGEELDDEFDEEIREMIRQEMEDAEVARLDLDVVDPVRVRRDSSEGEVSYDPDLELINVGEDPDPEDLADAVREHLVRSVMTEADARGFLNELTVYDLPIPEGETDLARAVAGVADGVTEDREAAEGLVGRALDDEEWEVYKAIARQFWVGMGTEGAVPLRRSESRKSEVIAGDLCRSDVGQFESCSGGSAGGIPAEDRERLKAWARGRPDDEVDAVRNYSGSGYQEINGVLRGRAGGTARHRERIDAIQKYIEASPKFDKPVTVWRGMSSTVDKNSTLARLKQFADHIGKRVRMSGFQSTSLNKSVAEDFAEEVILKITTERGAPVWPMLRQLEGEDAWDNNEQEVLLGHDWTYRVERVEVNPGGLSVVHLVAEGPSGEGTALKAAREGGKERKFAQPADAIVFL